VCSIELEQTGHDNLNPINVSLNLTIPGTRSIYKQSAAILAGTIVIRDLPLSYNVLVFFSDNSGANKIKGRQRVYRGFIPALVPDPVWRDWIVNIIAGSAKWSSIDTDPNHLPYCQVGVWDSGLFWVVKLGKVK
jgi:hypothetical protein